MKTFRILIASGFFLFSCTIFQAQTTATVTVTVEGISNPTGTIYAALCNDASAFPRGTAVQEIKVKVKKKGKMVFKFKKVPQGEYALRLYQDLDGNEKMDFNGPMPTEPFGFSNVKMMMGPPSFEQSMFKAQVKQLLPYCLWDVNPSVFHHLRAP